MTNKTIVAVTIAASIFASALVPAVTFASQSSDLRMIPVIVNGQKVKFPDTEPYIDGNGRTMVPVRFVSEKLGANVVWNDADSSVTIKYGSKVINLPLGSNVVTVDGKKVTLDTTAVLTEGRTMVPLRFVSEALSSEVTWDEGGHAVQVTDSSYKAKVINGSVELDAWGRELSKTWDANWNKLEDLSASFYNLPTKTSGPYSVSSKEFTTESREWDIVKYTNEWSERIRQHYSTQLNIDYRTIDEDTFVESLMSTMQFMSNTAKYRFEGATRGYVKWIKSNRVIAKGYADPENSQVRYESSMPIMRTHFKFMIIQADDTTQTFMDNYDPSARSESPSLKVGVWYDGYADVTLFSSKGNYQERSYAVVSGENMFIKNQYSYEEIK